MIKLTRRHLVSLVAALPLLANAAGEKPIQIIVPFGPGGSGDISARMLGDSLAKTTGRTVIVENKPGANGIIGVEAARRAPADGSTLLLATTSTHLANPSLFKKLPYNAEKDFRLIGTFGAGSTYLLVRPDSPYKKLEDLVKAAKAAPESITFGHFNATSNVSASMFASVTGIKLTAVPYKQVGQAMVDLMGGQLDLVFTDTVQGDSFVSSGQLRALAVQSNKRLKNYPNIPLIQEIYPNFKLAGGFLGIAVPAATPIETQRELNKIINDAINSDPMKSKLEGFGFTVYRASLEDMDKFGREERANWKKYVEIANIEVQ